MRVAVFLTPPAGHPLVNAAANWLGRDAFSGESLDRGPVAGLAPDVLDALTAAPRLYGFHATLKPPFRIAEGRGLADVEVAAAAFGRANPPTVIPALQLERIGPFFALTIDGDASAIDALAGQAVRAFEPFRAPLNDAEIARRRPERLTARQRDNLDAWGYPYVFAEFRFHMTLTGPVPEDRQAAVDAILRDRFAAFIGKPLPVEAIALFHQPASPGDFVVRSLFSLEAAAEPAVGA
jgi:putative phosphonate metabolism protein